MRSTYGSSPRVRGKVACGHWPADLRWIIPASAGQTIWQVMVFPPVPDHPRECGANKFPFGVRPSLCGSSPRVRGKLDHLVPPVRRPRIIPASAGQTLRISAPDRSRPDHPRECGANCQSPRITAVANGSSPRVRGKHIQFLWPVDPLRIIPASAGQTFDAGDRRRFVADHPRECGANSCAVLNASSAFGSSPRVRGKPHGRGTVVRLWADHPRECGANSRLRQKVSRCRGSSPRVRGKLSGESAELVPQRIIPASAGQTHALACVQALVLDHPRECGANFFDGAVVRGGAGSSPRVRGKLGRTSRSPRSARIIPASAGQTAPESLRPAAMSGSSPRVRGKRSRCCARHCLRRIIPASAGQTRHRRAKPRHRADHPRECGANQSAMPLSTSSTGSSPRVRGKHEFPALQLDATRIIPASAGQTRVSCPPTRRHADHPRECGANFFDGAVVRGGAGSSPRVRGKHEGRRTGMRLRRIIPASAGQTTFNDVHIVDGADHPRECGANR